MKTTDELAPGSTYFGAAPATRAAQPGSRGSPRELHASNSGVPGPSGERLPHFRLGFTPSGGDELQSEYVVAREHAADALRELRRLAPVVSPLLLISEIRAVAADTLWLSPFSERDSVAFHFTWKPLGDEVLAVLPQIEAALAPFGARPHWGKVFTTGRSSKPSTRSCRRSASFARGSTATGKFRNEFVDRYLGT